MTAPTKRESDLWERHWTRPQAVMWEANHQEEEVANYVRWFTKAERRDAKTDLGTLILRQQEALGLSLPGLARNRWIIATQTGEMRPKMVATTSAKVRVTHGG